MLRKIVLLTIDLNEDFLVGAYIVSSSGAAAKLHGEKLGKFQKSKDCLGQ